MPIRIATVLLILVVGAVLIATWTAWFRGRRTTDAQWPYYAKRPLSAPEQVLYWRLLRALPQHMVLCQVQVSRVLGVQKGHNFQAWNNRIDRLSYDFVVCEKDATVLGVIELDDASHQRERRREADERKSRATAAAGIALHRWDVAALPSDDEIKAAFASPMPNTIETSKSGEHSLLRLK